MALPELSAAGMPLLVQVQQYAGEQLQPWWHLTVQVALLAGMLGAGGLCHHAISAIERNQCFVRPSIVQPAADWHVCGMQGHLAV